MMTLSKSAMQLAIILAVSSCASMTKKISLFQPKNIAPDPASIPKQPENTTTTTTTTTATTKPFNPSSISAEAEYIAFFTRMASPENSYTEQDRKIFIKIPPNPSGGTIHEAALVVGLLRETLSPATIVTDVETNRGNQEERKSGTLLPQDLTKETNTSSTFEVRSKQLGINFTEALESNPFLKGRTIHMMVAQAIKLEGNSPEIIDGLRTIIKTETSNWVELANQLNIKQDEQPLISSNDIDNQPHTGMPPTETAQNTQDLLQKAKDLALKDQTEQAIQTAKSIPENSEVYTLAQASIKLWSDKASQELRKQAAQQYRASTAVGDSNGKRIYLSKAKSLLEEAIAKYPESSNLDTIKDNLEIINQELNRIR